MVNDTSNLKMASSANVSNESTKNANAKTNDIDVDNYIEEPHIIIDSCFRGRHLQRLVELQV